MNKNYYIIPKPSNSRVVFQIFGNSAFEIASIMTRRVIGIDQKVIFNQNIYDVETEHLIDYGTTVVFHDKESNLFADNLVEIIMNGSQIVINELKTCISKLKYLYPVDYNFLLQNSLNSNKVDLIEYIGHHAYLNSKSCREKLDSLFFIRIGFKEVMIQIEEEIRILLIAIENNELEQIIGITNTVNALLNKLSKVFVKFVQIVFKNNFFNKNTQIQDFLNALQAIIDNLFKINFSKDTNMDNFQIILDSLRAVKDLNKNWLSK
jgi:hypothetical protein